MQVGSAPSHDSLHLEYFRFRILYVDFAGGGDGETTLAVEVGNQRRREKLRTLGGVCGAIDHFACFTMAHGANASASCLCVMLVVTERVRYLD